MTQPRLQLRWWLRVGISLGLLGLCLGFIQFDELARALVRTDPWLFAAAFAVNVVGTILVRAWIAYLTTQASGLVLSFPELIRINLIARFYTLALPRGAAAAVRWHHYRKGGSGHAAAALLVFENIVSICTLFLSAAVILSLEGSAAGPAGRLLLPVCWLGVAASVLALLPFLNTRCDSILRRLLQPVLKRPGRIADLIGRLLEAVSSYRGIPRRRVGLIVLVSLCGYLLFVLSAWLLAQGMVLEVELAEIAWIRSVTLLVALLPITVAGLGLRETTLIALLRDYGVTPSLAFAYAMASFGIQVLLGAVGGALETRRAFGEHKVRPAPKEPEKT